MKNNIKAFFIFLIILFFNQKIHAQAGTLDPTFGDNGLVIYDIYTEANGSLIQPDGKIVLLSAGLYDATEVRRFNPDGSIDSTFGQNGVSSFGYGGDINYPSDIVIQEDGKLVFTNEYASASHIYVGIVRCNPDGTPDSSFGINGLDTVKMDDLNYADGLVIQPDGKIVVTGIVRHNFSVKPNSFLFRLKNNGGLDSSFGENGSVITHYDEYINTVGLVLRPNGKLVKGLTYNSYYSRPTFQLESFNSDGSVDAGFGTNGVARFTFGEGQGGQWNSDMRDLALQEDGKIVCTGTSGSPETTIALCRFNEDGSIDEGFGNAGGIIVPKTDPQSMYANSVTFQDDGKIVVCGEGGGWPWPMVLARFTQDGQMDPSFGENGITFTLADPVSSTGNKVHVILDGKILVIGVTSEYGILLARYNGDNVLATHFKEVKAIQENDNITITWQTLNESNTKSYTVERSNNAKDFVSISTIPAKHAASNSYSYTDKNPLYGDNYYRIKENAANGSFTYSQTLKVVFENVSNISLYPNPAKNTVTIKGLNKNATAVIKITDMNGREIIRRGGQSFSNTSSTTLSIRALAQGSYFILVEQNGKVTKLRMVKE